MGNVKDLKPTLTPLRLIEAVGGGVRHSMKSSDAGFYGFGEAYFSIVEKEKIKGWKRHRKMTLNLVPAVGQIQVVVCDDGGPILSCKLTPDLPEGYSRLTVPPGLWVAFGGIGDSLNMLLNIANIEHDAGEADRLPVDAFPWDWI